MDIYPSISRISKKEKYILKQEYKDFLNQLDINKTLSIIINKFHLHNENKEDIRDLFQESMIKLIKALSLWQYNPRLSNITTYLFTIFKNTYIDFVKQRNIRDKKQRIDQHDILIKSNYPYPESDLIEQEQA